MNKPWWTRVFRENGMYYPVKISTVTSKPLDSLNFPWIPPSAFIRAMGANNDLGHLLGGHTLKEARGMLHFHKSPCKLVFLQEIHTQLAQDARKALIFTTSTSLWHSDCWTVPHGHAVWTGPPRQHSTYLWIGMLDVQQWLDENDDTPTKHMYICICMYTYIHIYIYTIEIVVKNDVKSMAFQCIPWHSDRSSHEGSFCSN